MANEENLRPAPPWKPGQSGNPNGSSNKQRIRNAVVKLFDEMMLDEKFARVGIGMAMKGEFPFWKYLHEIIDGKIPEPDPAAPPVTMEDMARRLRERKQAKRGRKADE